MAFQVASLFGVLSLDDKDFQRGLKDADKGMKSTQDKIKDFGKDTRNTGLALMGLATPILAFAGASIRAAGESQQAIAQLDAVIKSTGGSAGVTSEHAQALASALQNVTTYGDETVISAENMLLTFTNIGASGGVFDMATKTALDMSTALGQDVTGSAMQLGKALNDPINGITALTRVGVTFTDAQKAQIEAMVKAGDVAGAQSLILQELQREFGGSAVAAGQTFPGQLAILNNKFGEVQEKIGAALIPALQNIVTNIGPIIDKAAAWISQNPELVANIVMVAGGAFALGGILTVLGTAIGLVSTAIGVLLSPAGLLIAAIAGIIFVADKLYPGGISKLFKDAQVAATQLAFLGMYVLANAAAWAQQKVSELLDTLNRAKGTLDALGGIGNLLSSGQITPQQLFNAIGAEISNNAGGSTPASAALGSQFGVQPIPPVGGGSAAPPGANNSINVGTMNIQANSAAEGAAAYDGFMSRARAQGAR